MVECAGLEIRYTVLRIEGSNPSFSARHQANKRLSGRFFHVPIKNPIIVDAIDWRALRWHECTLRRLRTPVKASGIARAY